MFYILSFFIYIFIPHLVDMEGYVMNGIYPLFSSSRGNATFIGNEKCGILIDSGVSYKRLGIAMNRCGISLSSVKAVFITHEHSDHVKGLAMLTKKHDLSVYGQGITLRNLIDNNSISQYASISEINSPVNIYGMNIIAFDTPHDTEQSCGYRINFENGRSCAICTDLGCVTRVVSDALTGTDTVLIEANYDDGMILTGPYPPFVKQRICSERGHLSNLDSAKQICRLVSSGTRQIILGHLSQENNTPHLADCAVENELSGFVRNGDYILQVAEVETSGNMVEI
jgi:phosphoribosyl 1,2-cyclic phosphodiesterase